jgi:hypothetical protein
MTFCHVLWGGSSLAPELIPNEHHAIVEDHMLFEVMHEDIGHPFRAAGHRRSTLSQRLRGDDNRNVKEASLDVLHRYRLFVCHITRSRPG